MAQVRRADSTLLVTRSRGKGAFDFVTLGSGTQQIPSRQRRLNRGGADSSIVADATQANHLFVPQRMAKQWTEKNYCGTLSRGNFFPMNKKKRRRLHQLCPLITIARLQPNLRLRPSRRSERLFRPSSAAASFRARTGYLHFSTTSSRKLSRAMTTT